MTKIFLIFSCLFILSCARISANPNIGNVNTAGGDPEVDRCSLQGAWVRCVATGVNSSAREIITVSGNTLSHISFVFNSNNFCNGNEDFAIKYDAQISTETEGSVPGGLNLNLTPTSDAFSCGIGNQAFTVFKLSTDCDSLQMGSPAPSCDPNSRPSSLQAEPYNRL